MMNEDKSKVFYSWQSDHLNATNRSLIQKCLKVAITEINADGEMVAAAREAEVDHDTQGLTGSPPIAEAIFKKIDEATAFVADLTFCGKSINPEKGRLFPNPNVLIEYGYAVKALSYDSVITVMNTAFGKPDGDSLPFDLKHLRHPITYHCDGRESAEEKKNIRVELTRTLKAGLEPIILGKAASIPLVAENLFEPDPMLDFDSTIFNDVKGLIAGDSLGAFRITDKTYIPDEGRIYLRIHPRVAVVEYESALDAVEAAQAAGLGAFVDASGWSRGRSEFGAVIYQGPEKDRLRNLTILGLRNEIIGLDASILNLTRCRNFSGDSSNGYVSTTYFEDNIATCLNSFISYYRGHTAPLPLEIHIAIQGVKGYSVYVSSRQSQGAIVGDKVEWTGAIQSYDESVAEILKPFMEKVWKAAGLKRPESENERLMSRWS